MHSRQVPRALGLAIVIGALRTASAEVGTVSALEGDSVRRSSSAEVLPLQVGSKVELGDTLEVRSGNLKISLTDESEIVLSSGSQLRIDEAEFKQLDHRRFSAWLLVGSVWSKVTKALSGSDAKFEVVTDRMVAGVRGTIFRVDIVPSSGDAKETLVHVLEGKVAVAHRSDLGTAGNGHPKLAELSAGERARATREGMRQERGRPPEKEGFERFIRSHERAGHELRERNHLRERAPRRR